MDKEDIQKEIRLQAKTNLNCLQACMWVISQENTVFVYQPWLVYWVFQFEKGHKIIADGIQQIPRFFLNDFYKKYLQVPVVFLEGNAMHDEKKLQQALNGGKKVMAETDTFYCPWNIAYGKSHMQHYIIIDSWDAVTGQYGCLDPYFKDKPRFVSFQQLMEICHNIRFFTISQNGFPYGLEEAELVRILLSNFSDVTEMWTHYRTFADTLLKVQDRSEIFESGDVSLCQMIFKIRGLARSRFSLAYALLEYEEMHIHFFQEGLYRDFYEMWEGWQSLYMQFMHTHLRGLTADKLERLAENILSQGNLECRIWEKIKNG